MLWLMLAILIKSTYREAEKVRKKNNKVLVFIANGVGRAVDSELLTLSSGIEKGLKSLNNTEKDIIKEFISLYTKDDISAENITNVINNEENEILAYINMVSMLTRMIKTGKGKLKERFVSQQFGDLANTINKFIYNVADSYNTEKIKRNGIYPENFEGFAQSLGGFIYKNKAHLATTNYDDLLYRYFLDVQIKTGENTEAFIMNPSKNTILSDGFTKTNSGIQFDFSNHDLNSTSWYMHLHGSSRFHSKFGSGNVFKSYKKYDSNHVPHIILNHFNLKEFEINLNPILHRYFDLFGKALAKINALYIIGYGGYDKHINNIVMNANDKCKIIIIERAQQDMNKNDLWRDLKSSNLDITLENSFENILDYRFPL